MERFHCNAKVHVVLEDNYYHFLKINFYEHYNLGNYTKTFWSEDILQ